MPLVAPGIVENNAPRVTSIAWFVRLASEFLKPSRDRN